MAVVAALALGASACAGTGTVPGAAGPAGPLGSGVRLVRHDSCSGLLDWIHREGAARVGPYGLTGGDLTSSARGALEAAASGAEPADATSSSAAPVPDLGQSSTTNTQEQGIGEPDLAWTDGNRVVTIVNGELEVVDLDAGEVTATIELGSDVGVSPVGLLVEGEHALVVQSGWSTGVAGGAARSADGVGADAVHRSGAPVTVLTRYDLGGSSIVGEITVEGDYVDARSVDGVVRTVVRSTPADLGFVYPSRGGEATVERATQANRQVVAETDLGDWLPSMTVDRGGHETTSAAVDCEAVAQPVSFAGFDVVTVLGLDLAAGSTEPLPATAVVAGAGTVYASPDALYVSTTRYPRAGGRGDQAPATTATNQVDEVTTEIHAFALPADAAARYEASGSVPGTLLDQFAMSEHDGHLRVATTTQPDRWSGPMLVEPDGGIASRRAAQPAVSESRVTVLRRDDDVLTAVGRVVGLGPTEQIRGVRFAGPQAYVVTFRQTDPLYVVDLADPTAPGAAGELKIDGYSSYLQVIGEGRVLGLGQDATDRGRVLGFQESLFDVSDPTAPTRMDQLVVEDGHSAAEQDHHAVLWWGPERLLAVPVESWTGTVTVDGTAGAGPTAGVLVTRVTDATIEAVGVVTHPTSDTPPRDGACPPDASCVEAPHPVEQAHPTPIVRTLVADGRLVTVSAAGVKVSTLADLADQAWIPLG